MGSTHAPSAPRYAFDCVPTRFTSGGSSRVEPAMTEPFDFIIVGAGSAGSVLANRLSEDGRNRVLVLEYGGSDRSIFIQMPSALSIPMDTAKYNWGYQTEPEPHLGGRAPEHAARQGARRLVVDQRPGLYPRQPARLRPLGGGGRARAGPIATCCPISAGPRRGRRAATNIAAATGRSRPATAAAKPALPRLHRGGAARPAIRETDDVNGFQQEGFGRMDMTVHDGRRWSAANAYLRPAMRRANLAVADPRARRRAIVFEGRRATGVRYRQRRARARSRHAAREVILPAARSTRRSS